MQCTGWNGAAAEVDDVAELRAASRMVASKRSESLRWARSSRSSWLTMAVIE